MLSAGEERVIRQLDQSLLGEAGLRANFAEFEIRYSSQPLPASSHTKGHYSVNWFKWNTWLCRFVRGIIGLLDYHPIKPTFREGPS